MNNNIITILGIALCAAVSSCQTVSRDTVAGPIRFTISDPATTKSSPIRPDNLSTRLGSFYTETFLVSGSPSASSPDAEAPFNGTARQLATRDEDATDNQYSIRRVWPSSGNALDFWCYGPVSEFGTAPSFNAAHSIMTFDYAPAHSESGRTDAADQKDVVVACTTNQSYDGLGEGHLVNITFQHALAGVRFKVGKLSGNFVNPDKIKITSVSLNGVYGKGNCSVTNAGAASWTPSTPAKYIQTFSNGYVPVSSSATDGYYTSGVYLDTFTTDASFGSLTVGTDIPETTVIGDEVFMLVPQTVPADATVVVNWSMYDDVAGEDIMYVSRPASIAGLTLEAGYIYTLTIDMDYGETEEKKVVNVTLNEVVPWEYVSTEVDYSHIVSMNKALEYSNCVIDGTNITFLEGRPDICGTFRLASPQGATFLVRLKQDFDAFEVVIDPSTRVISADGHDCIFYIRPKVSNPERDFVATVQISLRCADGRVIDIDDIVNTTEYKIILPRTI